jgi:hypothetical protein
MRPSLLLAGNLPYLAVVVLSGGAFMLGRATIQPHDKVAVVEKGAIVLEAVLAHAIDRPEAIDAEVRAPILALLRKYAQLGYTVIDVSRDDAGHMAVAAMPDGAIDITPEMRAAVGLITPAPAASQGAPKGVTP